MNKIREENIVAFNELVKIGMYKVLHSCKDLNNQDYFIFSIQRFPGRFFITGDDFDYEVWECSQEGNVFKTFEVSRSIQDEIKNFYANYSKEMAKN